MFGICDVECERTHTIRESLSCGHHIMAYQAQRYLERDISKGFPINRRLLTICKIVKRNAMSVFADAHGQGSKYTPCPWRVDGTSLFMSLAPLPLGPGRSCLEATLYQMLLVDFPLEILLNDKASDRSVVSLGDCQCARTTLHHGSRYSRIRQIHALR
jgi:hypothetical protein